MNSNALKIITRAVYQMHAGGMTKIEEDSYMHGGAIARADAATSDAIRLAVSAELKKHFDEVKAVHATFETEIKDNKRVGEGTKEAIAALNTKGAELVAKQQAAEVEYKKTQDRLLDIEQKMAARLAAGGGATRGKSLGQQFIESEIFTNFAKLGTKSVKASSSPFEVKTITSVVGSGGSGAFPEYLPTPVIPAFMPLTIRDLLSVGTTESNVINWVTELVFTNNAGYQGSEGALKPQSDITYALKSIPVETIGHWIKASKQILADFSMLRTLIDNRLTFGLKLAEEQQILYGDGTTNHLHGLVPQATPYNGGYASTDTKIDTIRRAMLQVTEAYYPATGIALSPYDWADIELTKDSYGRHIWSNPTSSNPGMLWGLPVAQCFSMQRGNFLVGSMKLAVTLFDREQASILLSTEDQDNFVRNLVTILAEERIALAVSRPAAIIYGDFKAGETG